MCEHWRQRIHSILETSGRFSSCIYKEMQPQKTYASLSLCKSTKNRSFVIRARGSCGISMSQGIASGPSGHEHISMHVAGRESNRGITSSLCLSSSRLVVHPMKRMRLAQDQATGRNSIVSSESKTKYSTAYFSCSTEVPLTQSYV